MKEQFHAKIHQLIQLAADGRLSPSQQEALDAHLADCAECRLYATELRALETQLASVSVTRLVPPASQQASLTAAIHSRYRRYQMNKQILSFAGTLVALAAVAVLIVLFGHFVPRQSSPATAPSATAPNEPPTVTIAVSTPTPQNQPLRFFIRAESDQLKLQPWQLTAIHQTPTLVLETVTPEPGSTYNLTVAEAEQLAGFDIFVPPTGLTWLLDFQGASFDSQRRIVRLFYTTGTYSPPDVITSFRLTEERDKISDYCQLCGVVDKDTTVDTVQIGETVGEYVEGTWILTDNGPSWEDTPYQKTLRWKMGDIAFELEYSAAPDIEATTKANMIAIADSLTSVSATMETPTPQSQPLGYFIHAESDTRPVETRVPGANTTPDSIESIAPNLSIAEAAQQAGFDVLAPTWLPDFLVLEGASFWPKQRIFEIVYGVAPNEPGENNLALMEQPIPENSDDCIIYPVACSMLVGASATIEEVQIGAIPGEYVGNGVWQAIDDSGQWGWDATPPIQKLRWHANGVAFELSTIIDGFSKKDLITIAEKLMAVSTIIKTPTPQNQPLHFFTRAESDQLPLLPWQLTPQAETPTPNPGWNFNLSITETAQLAGFTVLTPSWLPDTVAFGGASYQPDFHIVRIFYPRKSDPTLEYGFVLQIEYGQFNNDCDDLCGLVGLGAQVDTVQVGEFPGEYTVGEWIFTNNGPLWEYTTIHKVLRWQANGISYQLSYSGGPDDVTENDMIAIAERLR